MKFSGNWKKWWIRINRNIVECKYCLHTRNLANTPELIETLWNVNYIVCKLIPLYRLELIETLWNVNYLSVGDITSNRTELIETLWNVNIGNYLSQYSGN